MADLPYYSADDAYGGAPGAAGDLAGGGTGIFGTGGSGLTAAGVGGAASGVAGMVGGFFAAQGYDAEEGLYNAGAAAANEQAGTTRTLGQLEEFGAARKVGLVESSQRAAIARNGLQEAGSAADMLRESTIQGAQTKQSIMFSTQLKANQYTMQAEADTAEAKAAGTAATGAEIGGVLKGISGIGALASMFPQE